MLVYLVPFLQQHLSSKIPGFRNVSTSAGKSLACARSCSCFLFFACHYLISYTDIQMEDTHSMGNFGEALKAYSNQNSVLTCNWGKGSFGYCYRSSREPAYLVILLLFFAFCLFVFFTTVHSFWPFKATTSFEMAFLKTSDLVT